MVLLYVNAIVSKKYDHFQSMGTNIKKKKKTPENYKFWPSFESILESTKSNSEDSQHTHTKVPPAITHIVHSINHTMPKKVFSFGHSWHTDIEPSKIKYLSEHPIASTAEKETF